MNGATPEQLNALSKPVPSQHIRKDDRGNAHTTARFVMNRLDSTVGKQNWRDEYRTVQLGADMIAVECTLYILIDGEWVGKADVGTDEKFSPEKSFYSNALKRAAFKWGIARELYGEGNYYEQPEAAQDFEDQPEPDAAPPVQDRRFRDDPPPAKRSKTPVLDEVFGRDDEPGPDDTHDWSTDERTLDQATLGEVKLALVSAGMAEHPNHAANRILKAMNEAHGVDGWAQILKEFTVSAVWRAVQAHIAAK